MKRDYHAPLALLSPVEAADLIRTSGGDGDCWLSDCFDPLSLEQ